MKSVHIVSNFGLATVLWATAIATCSAGAVGSATFTKPGGYRNSAGTSIMLIAGTPNQTDDLVNSCDSASIADRRRQGCCTPSEGKGDVNTAVIDANGKIETFVCPTPGGDQTLNFGERAGLVNPDGTSSIADIATGATTAEAAVGVAAILAGVIGGGIGATAVENSNTPVFPPPNSLSP